MQAAGQPPIKLNSMLRVNVPTSQLSSTKVGDVIKGQVRLQGLAGQAGGVVGFTGQVASGTELSGTEGALTVRVLSDKYISPGTPVSGRVGNSIFTGTVIGSPNTQERLGNMEKRLSALEKPAKQQVEDLKTRLSNMKARLRNLEGRKSIKERIDDLQERIRKLEDAPPALDPNMFKMNREGFHFHGSIGPNTVEPTVDRVEQAVRAVEKAPTPEEAVEPVVNRLDEIEARMDKAEESGNPKKTLAGLEKRLVALERQASTY